MIRHQVETSVREPMRLFNIQLRIEQTEFDRVAQHGNTDPRTS